MNCITCKHYRMNGTCKAFPDRIPLFFISGEAPHDRVIKGQQGSTIYEQGENEFSKGLMTQENDFAEAKPTLRQRIAKMRKISRQYRG